MTGKIIDKNLIAANNGKRYTFTLNNVANLKPLQNMKALIGASVDFETQDDKANSVYIVQTKLSLINFAGDFVRSINTLLLTSTKFGSISGLIYTALGITALCLWFVSLPLIALYFLCLFIAKSE